MEGRDVKATTPDQIRIVVLKSSLDRRSPKRRGVPAPTADFTLSITPYAKPFLRMNHSSM